MSFESAWEHSKAWLQAALDAAGGTHSLDDVKALCGAGEARLWAWPDAAAVTEFIEHPNGRDLSVWLAGGNMETITGPMREAAEAYAREEGCRRITIAGRKGWVRALRQSGYGELAVTTVKELG